MIILFSYTYAQQPPEADGGDGAAQDKSDSNPAAT